MCMREAHRDWHDKNYRIISDLMMIAAQDHLRRTVDREFQVNQGGDGVGLPITVRTTRSKLSSTPTSFATNIPHGHIALNSRPIIIKGSLTETRLWIVSFNSRHCVASREMAPGTDDEESSTMQHIGQK